MRGAYSASGGGVCGLRRVVACWWRYCGGYFGRVVRLRVFVVGVDGSGVSVWFLN